MNVLLGISYILCQIRWQEIYVEEDKQNVENENVYMLYILL